MILMNSKLVRFAGFFITFVQSAYGAVEAVELLKVTVDNDPTVSKLILYVDSETQEIKSGKFADGSKKPPHFEPEDLSGSGVTLKTNTIPVTILRTEQPEEKASTSIGSFFNSDKEVDPRTGGDLELKLLKVARGLDWDYVRFPFKLSKPKDEWIVTTNAKEFDGIHFTPMKEKDVNKDYQVSAKSGHSVESYCEKNSDGDQSDYRKCVAKLNKEVGIKSLELTNGSKTVETLETKKLPEA